MITRIFGLKGLLGTALVGVGVIVAAAEAAERIKDIASISGVRNNQLVGYGLVVGLDGTGDQVNQAPFTAQSLRSMLSSQGVNIPDDVNIGGDNVAAVMVTAQLPPFTRSGQEIDVRLSSIGNAESLQGGQLLMTPLRGGDGRTYAIAQGQAITSGFGAGGADGSQIEVDTPTAASIPSGAIVERRAPSGFAEQDEVVLHLNTPDFTTARRTAEVINDNLGPNTARASDAVTVRVQAPRDTNQRVSFISYLEELRVEPGDAPARVIVNARTGTIVMGSNVSVRPAAVTHGSMTVAIAGAPDVVDEDPFGIGEPLVVPDEDLDELEGDNPMFMFEPGASLQEIVAAVNSVGAAPGDLVAILEALKEAGALRAELVII